MRAFIKSSLSSHSCKPVEVSGAPLYWNVCVPRGWRIYSVCCEQKSVCIVLMQPPPNRHAAPHRKHEAGSGGHAHGSHRHGSQTSAAAAAATTSSATAANTHQEHSARRHPDLPKTRGLKHTSYHLFASTVTKLSSVFTRNYKLFFARKLSEIVSQSWSVSLCAIIDFCRGRRSATDHTGFR